MARTTTVLAALAAALAVAGCGGPSSTQPTTPACTALNGCVSSDAGPASRPQCDPNRANAYPDGRAGVVVVVNVRGPDVVYVDVIAGMGYAYHRSQQVTKRASGAEFDFPATGPPFSIMVSTDKLGMCDVPVPEVSQ